MATTKPAGDGIALLKADHRKVEDLFAKSDIPVGQRDGGSAGQDCPEPRPIQPPSAGTVVAFPQVGGLHHRYERRAA
jgi:hypothetical protein